MKDCRQFFRNSNCQLGDGCGGSRSSFAFFIFSASLSASCIPLIPSLTIPIIEMRNAAPTVAMNSQGLVPYLSSSHLPRNTAAITGPSIQLLIRLNKIKPGCHHGFSPDSGRPSLSGVRWFTLCIINVKDCWHFGQSFTFHNSIDIILPKSEKSISNYCSSPVLTFARFISSVASMEAAAGL